MTIAANRPVPKTFRGSVAITRSAARTWRVPTADEQQSGDERCEQQPDREQEERGSEERAKRDQLGIDALDVAGYVRAFGLGHGRLDGADVAEDGGSFLECERAADDHDRLDGRAVERRVPVDHRQRVDGSGDVRIAVHHEDDVSLLSDRHRDVATEGHQDASGVGERLVRGHRDGNGERRDDEDGPEQAGQAFHANLLLRDAGWDAHDGACAAKGGRAHVTRPIGPFTDGLGPSVPGASRCYHRPTTEYASGERHRALRVWRPPQTRGT